MYMSEIGLIILIFLAGLSVVRTCITSAAPVFSAIAAFPVGLFIWSLCHLIIYFSPYPAHPSIPFTIVDAHATLLLFSGVTVLLGGISLYRAKLIKQELLAYGGALLVLVGSDVVLAQFPIFVLTGDSYTMLQIDQPLSHSLQGGFPIFNQTLQSLSLVINYDYLFMSLYQLVAICLAALMSYLTFGEVRRQVPRTWVGYGLLVACAPPALLLSTYVGLWQAFYLNHHVLMANYLLLFGTVCWLAIVKGCRGSLYVGVLALLAVMLTRMEGLPCAAVILPIFLSDPQIPSPYQRKAALLFAAGITPWYLYVIRSIGSLQGIFGSGTRYAVMLLFALAIALMFQMNRWRAGRKFLRHLNYFIPTGVWIVCLMLIRFNPRHMLADINMILMTLFNDTRGLWDNPLAIGDNRHGAWGSLWYFMTGATLLILGLRSRTPRLRVMEAFFLASIALAGVIMDMSYVVIPYGIALTSSVNRMIVHVVPLLLVWSVTQLSQLTQQHRFKEETTP